VRTTEHFFLRCPLLFARTDARALKVRVKMSLGVGKMDGFLKKGLTSEKSGF
jgi:hypothetical protein